MTWHIENNVFTDAWEAADFITDGESEKTVNIARNLETMHDGEINELNGLTVTSFLIIE